jgi:hypothetical protein
MDILIALGIIMLVLLIGYIIGEYCSKPKNKEEYFDFGENKIKEREVRK